MGREFELKYAASPEKLALIRSQWENWEIFSMATTYFDTADGALSSKTCTLRQRLENGVSVCTLKTPAAGFGRGEWDVQAPCLKSGITLCPWKEAFQKLLKVFPILILREDRRELSRILLRRILQ